jgi:hypothetical protein
MRCAFSRWFVIRRRMVFSETSSCSGDRRDGQHAYGGAPRRRGWSVTHCWKALALEVEAWVRPPSPVRPQRGAPGCLRAASAAAEPHPQAALSGRSAVWRIRLSGKAAKLNEGGGQNSPEQRGITT